MGDYNRRRIQVKIPPIEAWATDAIIMLPNEDLYDWLNAPCHRLKFHYVPLWRYYRLRADKYLRVLDRQGQTLKFLADRRRASLDLGATVGILADFRSLCQAAVHACEPNPIRFRRAR